MGNTNKRGEKQPKIKLEKNTKIIQYSNYHCIKCKEIPFIYFNFDSFNMACSTHKINNIPINQFYNYISFNCICFTCKSFTSNDYIYCYECNKIYCIQCMQQSKTCSHKNNNIINVKNMNTICKLHHKKYNKFCLNCKEHLCEQCENHNNEHYIELLDDIIPTDEEIQKYNETKINILNKKIENFNNSNTNVYGLNDYNELTGEKKEELFNKQKKCIEIKSQLINSFSKDISNYIYINNINNIIKSFHDSIEYEDKKKDIENEDNIKIKEDKNNIENKILIKTISEKIMEDHHLYSIWCMMILNDIITKDNKKFELIAMGLSNGKIILFNILKFTIYQEIDQHDSSVYSLEQYKSDPNYLFSSSNDSSINIYKLNDDYKYELIQSLEKEESKNGQEINKIIILYNKLLVSGDRRSITIWKNNNENDNKNKNNIEYEEFFEIVIDRDICQLLEVNTSVFVSTQYNGGYFQVYRNDNKSFPMLGELTNIATHGSSSNGLGKINDNIVCSGGKEYISIISIEPLQEIQKIMTIEKYSILYINVNKVNNNNYLYMKGYHSIIQYKIINDEDNNFVELIELFNTSNKYDATQKAILTFDDGRIFFCENKGDHNYLNLYA